MLPGPPEWTLRGLLWARKSYQKVESFQALNIREHLPKLPAVPFGGRGSLHTEVTYMAPETEMVTLGYLPGDAASFEVASSPYTRYNGEEYKGRNSAQLFTHKPKLDANGKPILVAKAKRIDVDPALNRDATAAGVIGGVVGGILGGVVGLVVGAPGLGALWGAGAGAALFGGGTLVEEGVEKARLEWRERSINGEKMVGFSPSPGKTPGLDRGLFKADIQSTSLGTYWEPVVVRYNSLTGTILSEH